MIFTDTLGAKLTFGLFDSRVDGEHSGVGLVDISKIFAMRDIRFFLLNRTA